MKKNELLSWLEKEIDGMQTIVIHRAHNTILSVWRKDEFINNLIDLAYYLGKLDAFERVLDKVKEG